VTIRHGISTNKQV